MKKEYLGVVTVALLGAVSVAAVQLVGTKAEPALAGENAAVRLAAGWFDLIARERAACSVWSPAGGAGAYPGLIGVEWSEITTTLGSLDAKITAANPAFAGVLVRMLHTAGIRPGDTVGVALSGSFPSLSVAVLAALQVTEARAVVASSVGASSFGANDPSATWPDMESWLRARGGLQFASSLVTPGGENDNGGGLSEKGNEQIANAALRNGYSLVRPASLDEALQLRLRLFRRPGVKLFINVGGNQTSLGSCVHASGFPTGLHFDLPSCGDPGRGLLARMAEQAIPTIHLLNVRNLAFTNGLPLLPRKFDPLAMGVRSATPASRILAGLAASLLLLLLYLLRTRNVPLILTRRSTSAVPGSQDAPSGNLS
jgi:poly-gamma-glutamate system protein